MPYLHKVAHDDVASSLGLLKTWLLSLPLHFHMSVIPCLWLYHIHWAEFWDGRNCACCLLESKSLARGMNYRLHLPSVIVLWVRVCEWSRKCYSTQVSAKDDPKREVKELLPPSWNRMSSEKLLCKHQEIRDHNSAFSSSALAVVTFLFLLFSLLISFLSSVAFSNLTLQIPFAAWLQNFPFSISARKSFWRWLPIFSSQCEHKGNSFLPCFLLKQSSLQSYHQQTGWGCTHSDSTDCHWQNKSCWISAFFPHFGLYDAKGNKPLFFQHPDTKEAQITRIFVFIFCYNLHSLGGGAK